MTCASANAGELVHTQRRLTQIGTWVWRLESDHAIKTHFDVVVVVVAVVVKADQRTFLVDRSIVICWVIGNLLIAAQCPTIRLNGRTVNTRVACCGIFKNTNLRRDQ